MNVSLFLRSRRLAVAVAAAMVLPAPAAIAQSCVKDRLAVATFTAELAGSTSTARCLLLKEAGTAPSPFCALFVPDKKLTARSDNEHSGKTYTVDGFATMLGDVAARLRPGVGPQPYPRSAVDCLKEVVKTETHKSALAAFFKGEKDFDPAIIPVNNFPPIQGKLDNPDTFLDKIITLIAKLPSDVGTTDGKTASPKLEDEVRTLLAAMGETVHEGDLVAAVQKAAADSRKWIAVDAGKAQQAKSLITAAPGILDLAVSLKGVCSAEIEFCRNALTETSINLLRDQKWRMNAEALPAPPPWQVIAVALTALLIAGGGSAVAAWMWRDSRIANAAENDEAVWRTMLQTLGLHYPSEKDKMLSEVGLLREHASQWHQARRKFAAILEVPENTRPEEMQARVNSQWQMIKTLAAPAPGEAGVSTVEIERRAQSEINRIKRDKAALDALAPLVERLKAVSPGFDMTSWQVDELRRGIDLLLGEADAANTLAQARENIKMLRQRHQADLQRAESERQTLRNAVAAALGLPPDAAPEEIVDGTRRMRQVSQVVGNAFRSVDNPGAPVLVTEALRQLQQWSRDLGGDDNLAGLVDRGRARINTLSTRIAAMEQTVQGLKGADRTLSELENILGAGRDQVVPLVIRQKQDLGVLRTRCDELEPKVERGLRAEELARAWDGLVRPVMTGQLAYDLPQFSSAADLQGFAASLAAEHPASRQFRLALMVANMDQSSALSTVREAGRDDVLAALGFQTIDQDLQDLFPEGSKIARDKAAVWSDLVGPGLNTGTLVRIFRAKVLLAGYYGADPVFRPLRDLVDAFSAELMRICHKAGCRITIPTILGPPQAGFDQHWDALPELRRLPEVRKRLEDAITRREAIVVDIHNIGVTSPTDSVRPGVVMLNPADW